MRRFGCISMLSKDHGDFVATAIEWRITAFFSEKKKMGWEGSKAINFNEFYHASEQFLAQSQSQRKKGAWWCVKSITQRWGQKKGKEDTDWDWHHTTLKTDEFCCCWLTAALIKVDEKNSSHSFALPPFSPKSVFCITLTIWDMRH